MLQRELTYCTAQIDRFKSTPEQSGLPSEPRGQPVRWVCPSVRLSARRPACRPYQRAEVSATPSPITCCALTQIRSAFTTRLPVSRAGVCTRGRGPGLQHTQALAGAVPVPPAPLWGYTETLIPWWSPPLAGLSAARGQLCLPPCAGLLRRLREVDPSASTVVKRHHS